MYFNTILSAVILICFPLILQILTANDFVRLMFLATFKITAKDHTFPVVKQLMQLHRQFSFTGLPFVHPSIVAVQFLPCDAMLAQYMPLLCVCLSVTLWYCIKMAKCRIMQIMPHDSTGNVVF